MDRDEAWARVRSARVGRMATVTPSCRPHVVPFVFVLVERGSDRVAYWVVDHKPKRSTDLKRLRNVRENPAVEFVVDGYDENWRRLWWVRCSGTARVVVSQSERRDALRALGEKYPQYAAEPPNGPVVAIDIDTIRTWEAAVIGTLGGTSASRRSGPERKEDGMGILDKAKAAAGKVAEEAKKGTAQVQDKVEQSQTRKKADEFAKQLGYLIVKERSGGEPAGPDGDRLVADILILEAKLAAGPDPAPGGVTTE